MTLSLVMLLLPHDLLSQARDLTQPLALVQLAATQATHKVTDPFEDLGREEVDPGDHADLVSLQKALENENTVLREQIGRLNDTVRQLAGIRKQGFPPDGVLIPARVLAMDAAPGRESMTVGKGQVQDVEDHAWVLTHLHVEAGRQDGVIDHAAVLARQCLIGWVDHAAPLTSRVVLLSDPVASGPRRVHIAPRRKPEGRHPLLADEDGQAMPFVLEGAGGGRMRIRDIPATLVEDGTIRVGDLVTSDPNDPGLPLAMVIGELEQLELNRENPVHYDATARHMHNPRTLSRVFIAQLGPH